MTLIFSINIKVCEGIDLEAKKKERDAKNKGPVIIEEISIFLKNF